MHFFQLIKFNYQIILSKFAENRKYMKKFSLILLVVLNLFACQQQSVEEIEKSIDEIETEIKASNQLDTEKVQTLIDLYELLISKKDKKDQPPLLEKKAKYYASLGQHENALNVYEKIYEQYLDYEKRGEALFMQAFITEVNQSDLSKAEALYKKYLKEFPNGDFAKDAQFSIENLYLSPEELIQKFKDAEQNSEAEIDSII